jgi:hypothetical protein
MARLSRSQNDMQDILDALDIKIGPLWPNSAISTAWPHHMFIDDIAIELGTGKVGSWTGAGPDKLVLTITKRLPVIQDHVVSKKLEIGTVIPGEPEYILLKNWREEKRAKKEGHEYKEEWSKTKNLPKAWLAEWQVDSKDADGSLRLTLGSQFSGGRFDYWTQQAMMACTERLMGDFVQGKPTPHAFPWLVCCHCVVVTDDNQLLLSFRTKEGAGAVEYHGEKWSVSFEEQTDHVVDLNKKGKIDPIRTVVRGIGEELHLKDIAEQANVKVLAMGLEPFFSAALIMFVKIPVPAQELKNRFAGAEESEHRGIHTIPFTIQECLQLLRYNRGPYDGPLHGTSRLRLLAALFHCFGFDVVRKAATPTSTPSIIWFHGEQTYSSGGKRPISVSNEAHNALRAFFKRKVALTTSQIAEEGVSNVSRVMTAISKKFPGCVQIPSGKGTGYFVRVRKASTSSK